MRDKILSLRQQGKTYNEIASLLSCAKSTVAYHCSPSIRAGGLERNRRFRNKSHPYLHKLYYFTNLKRHYKVKLPTKYTLNKIWKDKILDFFRDRTTKMYKKTTFTVQDVINKFTEQPLCYLSGQSIDIHKPSTYQFDHIIPASRGGNNSLDNLGICTRRINIAKGNMTPDEFIFMCKSVLEHNGYTISKTETAEIASAPLSKERIG